MTTEEKLQHFYDVAMNEAKKEAETMLAEHQKKLTEQLEQHKQEKRKCKNEGDQRWENCF